MFGDYSAAQQFWSYIRLSGSIIPYQVLSAILLKCEMFIKKWGGGIHIMNTATQSVMTADWKTSHSKNEKWLF